MAIIIIPLFTFSVRVSFHLLLFFSIWLSLLSLSLFNCSTSMFQMNIYIAKIINKQT